MCTRYDIGYYLFLFCEEKEVEGTVLEGIGNFFQDACVARIPGGLDCQEFWHTEVNLPEGWMDLPKEEALRQAIFAWKVSFPFDESSI